jgi:hypothetical protein
MKKINRCLDCRKIIDNRAKRCRPCSVKGENIMKIVKEVNHKNGDVTITYTLNGEEDLLLRMLSKAQNKKYTKKFINGCILEGIKNLIKEHKCK